MTKKADAIVVPQVSVNEEWVTISHLTAAGDHVSRGDLIVSLSTDKADMDLEAPADGYIWPVVAQGDRVCVGGIVAYLTRTPERPENLAAPERAKAQPRATGKAIALAGSMGVDLSRIVQRGIIRQEDVRAFAGRMVLKAAGENEPAAVAPPEDVRGRINPEFLATIHAAESDFKDLPGDEKIRLYRKHGGIIGERVTIGREAVIRAEAIVIGDECEIGDRTTIQAQTLIMGRGCLIGRDNDILCRHIRFGDMLYLVNRILIGQGGAFNPESRLEVGHSCLISSDCLINTAHQVLIGDRSCLSPHVSIYTHSHWQNVLEGYRAVFAPVMIGNDVWITGNCLVTPGTVMEDGSQALANSVVSGHVPRRTVVSGVPARPVRTVRGGLSLAEKDHLMRGIWKEVEHALRIAGLEVSSVLYSSSLPRAECTAGVHVAFGACPEGYEGTFFDLNDYRVTGPRTQASDEVRNVLRKHGIRFEPHNWRYRADIGKFNA